LFAWQARHACSPAKIASIVSAALMLGGCTMLDTASPASSQATPLSWLTNWVNQPVELTPGFDVESIKPDPRPVTVQTENLLEITVWDLYEPGKPYSFPVRVSSRKTIEVPFLGEVPVEGRTVHEIETTLRDGYHKGEYLLNPRVLVRSLDSPLVKVLVAGAVNRGGFVELSRADPSVYAAIVSAGGLRKTAGTQVAVTRRAGSGSMPQPEIHTNQPASMSADGPGDDVPPNEPHPPAQRANSLDELSVPPSIQGARPAANQALFSVVDTDGNGETRPMRADAGPVAHTEEVTVWYDVSLPHDREQLKSLQLNEGDSVNVKAAAPPLRIDGIVNRPGAYPLPPGRILNVWEAIEMAGGVRDGIIPLNITLLRPAAEGRGARRSSLHVDAYEDHPAEAPQVEAGAVLHVEPTTGSKIRRAVGDWWHKP
jgi:protein involved in polysaccharide export with SLBB domain